MAITPIVRYMILCEDWSHEPDNPRRVNIYGLLSNIDSKGQPFPLVLQEMCVFLALTEARGTGTVQIVCTHEQSSRRIFHTPTYPVSFGDDPLDIVAVPFRIRDCRFPFLGMYQVEFWYNEDKVEERPLRVR